MVTSGIYALIDLAARLALLTNSDTVIGFKIKPRLINSLTADFYFNFGKYNSAGMLKYTAENGELVIDASRSMGKLFTVKITHTQEMALKKLIAEANSCPDYGTVACHVIEMGCQQSIILLSVPNAEEVLAMMPGYMASIEEVW